jgi:hypothetical protein
MGGSMNNYPTYEAIEVVTNCPIHGDRVGVFVVDGLRICETCVAEVLTGKRGGACEINFFQRKVKGKGKEKC